MSQPDNDSTRKTMAIRVDPEIHAELQLIAQLRGHTLADEHLQAVLTHIERARDQADLAERADQAIEEIEREAALRRDAINRLRRSSATPTTATEEASSTEPPAPPQKRSRRNTDPSEG